MDNSHDDNDFNYQTDFTYNVLNVISTIMILRRGRGIEYVGPEDLYEIYKNSEYGSEHMTLDYIQNIFSYFKSSCFFTIQHFPADSSGHFKVRCNLDYSF